MFDSLRKRPMGQRALSILGLQLPERLSVSVFSRAVRQDLDGIDRAFPNHKRVVLIGHSMGGMICD